MSDKSKIVAIIPCYNTASHIAEVATYCVKYIKTALHGEHEVD